MQHRIARIVWITAGFAGWVFGLCLLLELAFWEIIAGIAIKNGCLTFFGWSIISFVMIITCLMIWRMLKEIHCSTGTSVLLALIIATCIGFMEATSLGSEGFPQIFGHLTWILIIIVSPLLVLIFLRFIKIKGR